MTTGSQENHEHEWNAHQYVGNEEPLIGTAIVAHEMERLRVIAGDDAFLLDTDDIPAVARTLQAAAPSTAEQRERRANKAEKYSWQKIGAMYREFLAEVIASR